MLAKTVARRWLPPVLLEHLKPLLKSGIYFSGNYADWSTASANTTGYDSAMILERVKQAMLEVTAGKAVFERDSMLFDEVRHSFPVLAGLLRAGVENTSRLSVLDFGGSLGSSYFQCRDFLSVLPSLQWGVVEQEHFVRCGQEHFETGQLRFFFTIKECAQEIMPDVALLSSVLQYIPEPYKVLDDLRDSGIQYIVIDRTPFSAYDDFITIQYVPPTIYAASYPCRVFSTRSFIAKIRIGYDVLAEFDSDDGMAVANFRQFRFGGMILRKK